MFEKGRFPLAGNTMSVLRTLAEFSTQDMGVRVPVIKYTNKKSAKLRVESSTLTAFRFSPVSFHISGSYSRDNWLHRQSSLVAVQRFVSEASITFFRFTKNTFFVEKNPTIVNFPIRGIEFGDLLKPDMKVKYPKGATYDLIANIVHEGDPKNGKYKVHILHKGQWSQLNFCLNSTCTSLKCALLMVYLNFFESSAEHLMALDNTNGS